MSGEFEEYEALIRRRGLTAGLKEALEIAKRERKDWELSYGNETMACDEIIDNITARIAELESGNG